MNSASVSHYYGMHICSRMSLTLGLLAILGCGGGETDGGSSGSAGNGFGGTAFGGAGFGSGLGSGASSASSGGSSGPTGFDAGEVCVGQSVEAELRPVVLAFAFDVSGSMGKLDYPHHDPALKWEPVVTATKAFFADPDSQAISASLTFFPARSDKCDVATYTAPDVPITRLPSPTFAAAIDAIAPQTMGDWRGGTPTLAVVNGTFSWLAPLLESEPGNIYALVLVTDGYPQNCDDNSIEQVSTAIEARADRIPTYVIGVRNPPGGPDTVSDLNALATAGRTEQAYFIETGDPERTKADFKAAIDVIRGKTISCNIEIPTPPSDQVIEPSQVNVTYTSGSDQTPLALDQACEHANTWRYDDPAAPGSIVLCPSACAAVQSDANARLLVEFGCTARAPVVH